MDAKFFKTNFKFIANRYEEWQGGYCISKGIISTEIIANVNVNYIHFELNDIGNIRMQESFDFEITNEDFCVLSDRIQYVSSASDFNPIVPVVCHIFFKGATIECVRFAMTNPDRIIEFYGILIEYGLPLTEKVTTVSNEAITYEVLENLDNELMVQFMVESMDGFEYSPKQHVSESIGIAEIQLQYKHYCMQAKANIVSNNILQNENTLMINRIKNQICKYINSAESRRNDFMRLLYDSHKDAQIIQQISTIVKGVIYKNYADISYADRRKSLDLEQVSNTISVFVYFTILVNDVYVADDFNKLFVETWFTYYDNWMSSELLFKMNGSSWRKQFEGVLLFD